MRRREREGDEVTVQEEIGRLVWEAEDLGEFLEEACRLRGRGTTRASLEAGLSRNGFSSYVKGTRRPSHQSAYKIARYFGVPQAQILRLAGFETAGVDLQLLHDVVDVVRNIIVALDADELADWVQFGEMLLLLRERRIMEEARGEVEGEPV